MTAFVRVCVRAWVRACVRAFVWSSDVTLASFSSLWPAFTLTVHINALYNENVQRQEQHSSGINTITQNIDFIAVGIFQVGQQFMKLGSLLYVRCRHRSHCGRKRVFVVRL